MAPEARGKRQCCVTLDRTVAFLSKRDGIDKVLKSAKYLSSLGIALRTTTPTPAKAGAQLHSHAHAKPANASAISYGAAFGKTVERGHPPRARHLKLPTANETKRFGPQRVLNRKQEHRFVFSSLRSF